MEFSIPLNKFEKEKRVEELHLEGKTIRETSKVVHMSFRDISKIIKSYDKKVRLQQTKNEEQKTNQQITTKKLSLSSKAFKLFKEGKKPTEVAIELDISYKQVSKFWYQFLKLENKFDCYKFYEACQNDLPSLLSINNFIKRNNIFGPDIANVLRVADDTAKLYQTHSNLKIEINRLEQTKNNYSFNQNTSYQQLLPLGLPEHCYSY